MLPSVYENTYSFNELNKNLHMYEKKAGIEDQFAEDIKRRINSGNYQVSPSTYSQTMARLNELVDSVAQSYKSQHPQSAQLIDAKAQQIKSILATEVGRYYAPIRLKFDKSLYYYFAPEDSLKNVLQSKYIHDSRNRWNELIRNPEVTKNWGNIPYDVAVDRLLVLSKIALGAAVERPDEISSFSGVRDVEAVLSNSRAPRQQVEAARKVAQFHNKYNQLIDEYLLQGINLDEGTKQALKADLMKLIWHNPSSLFAASSKAYYTLISAATSDDPQARHEILDRFLRILSQKYPPNFSQIEPYGPYNHSFLLMRALLSANYKNPTLMSDALSRNEGLTPIINSINKEDFEKSLVRVLNSRPDEDPRVITISNFSSDPYQAVILKRPSGTKPNPDQIRQYQTAYANKVESEASPIISSAREELANRRANPSTYEWYDFAKKHWPWGFYGAGGLLGLLGILELLSRRKKSPGFMKLLLALGIAAIPFIYKRFFEGKQGITEVLVGKGEPPPVELQPAPNLLSKSDSLPSLDKLPSDYKTTDMFSDYQPTFA